MRTETHRTRLDYVTGDLLDGIQPDQKLVQALVMALYHHDLRDLGTPQILFRTCVNRWKRSRQRVNALAALRVAEQFPGQIDDGELRRVKQALANRRRSRHRRRSHKKRR